MVVVTRAGFGEDSWTRSEALASGAIAPAAALDADGPAVSGAGVEIAGDADLDAIAPKLGTVALVSIRFPSFADGRGFSLARRLRDRGYAGRLRASGHVLSDQFAFALQCGFDEVEIDRSLAARQPEAHWREDANRIGWYQNKFAQRRALAAE